MLAFPSTLPRPIWGGYAIQPQDTRAITPVNQGFPRVRRRSAITPTLVPCKWRLTDDQFEVFRHFVEVGLRGGVESFTFGVMVGGAFFDEECVFSQYPSYAPLAPNVHEVEATLIVTQKLGLPMYRDLAYTDAGATVIVGTLTGSRTVWRAEIYVRTAVNAGTSAILRLGHAGDSDAYITDVSVAAAGRIVVVDGGGNDGILMGATESTTRVVQAQLVTTGTAATAGDLSVALFWRA